MNKPRLHDGPSGKSPALLLSVAMTFLPACEGSDGEHAEEQPWQWEVVGPSTAFALSFAFHPTDPNVVFLGADDGAGIWRSTDGGNTFNLVSAEVPDVSGYALVIDADEPSRVYGGCGSGRGILRSTDGGDSWVAANQGLDSFDERTVISLAVDPSTPGRVFAATTGGLLRSNDHGQSWAAAGTMGPALAATWRIVITGRPGGGTRMYALMGSFGGPPSGSLLHASDDGGTTWVDLTSGLRTAGAENFNPDDLEVTATGTIYVGGTRESLTAVFRSTDEGATFSRLSPQEPAVFGRVAVDPSDEQTVYVSGSLDLGTPMWVSRDGGDSFEVTGGDAFAGAIPISLEISPHPGNRIFYGLFGDLYLSDDGGASFRLENSNLTHGYANALAAGTSTKSCVYAGLGAHNSTYPERNAFRWCGGGQAEEVDVPDDTYAFAVRPDDDDGLIAGTLSRGVQVSVDGGANFASATGFAPEPSTALAVWAGPDGLVLASGADSAITSFGLFRSTDGGRSFDHVSSELLAARFAAAGTRILAAGEGGVLASADQGLTWTRLLDAPGVSVTALAVLDASGEAVLVGTSDGDLRRSADGGVTWTTLDSPFTEQAIIGDVLVDRERDIVYVGLHPSIANRALDRPSGLWESYDQGTTFTEVQAARPSTLSSLLITALVWDPAADRTLYAATWGSGVVRLQLD
jgi:photosystem II stability/assembly factor-like uncharacterized protein